MICWYIIWLMAGRANGFINETFNITRKRWSILTDLLLIRNFYDSFFATDRKQRMFFESYNFSIGKSFDENNITYWFIYVFTKQLFKYLNIKRNSNITKKCSNSKQTDPIENCWELTADCRRVLNMSDISSLSKF